jgi:hypothetical protein
MKLPPIEIKDGERITFLYREGVLLVTVICRGGTWASTTVAPALIEERPETAAAMIRGDLDSSMSDLQVNG